jgi:hypothetical protein
MLFAVAASEPEKGDPSVMATAIVERAIPTGLLSGTDALAGVRTTVFGIAGAAPVAVIAALFAITLKLLLEKKRTSYWPAEGGITR